MKILMVCLGNICRSPLAEGILEQQIRKAGLHWQVDSAGTNGYHVGEPPHKLSQKVALLNGLDISHQTCRKFSPNDFAHYDAIYAMSEDVIDEMKWMAGKHYDASKVALLLDELYPGESRSIPDPWYGEEPGYHEVYGLIRDACEAIIAKSLQTMPR